MFKSLISDATATYVRWEESNKCDQTAGIKMKDLNGFVNFVKSDFHFPSKDLSDQIGATIKDLAKKCDTKGLTSTVYGDLDDKTKMCGIVHCIKDTDGTVTVSYAIKTLRTEKARKSVLPDIKSVPYTRDQQGVDSEMKAFLRSTEDLLKTEAGVDLSRLAGSAEESPARQVRHTTYILCSASSSFNLLSAAKPTHLQTPQNLNAHICSVGVPGS